jgi:hypothetical protein
MSTQVKDGQMKAQFTDEQIIRIRRLQDDVYFASRCWLSAGALRKDGGKAPAVFREFVQNACVEQAERLFFGYIHVRRSYSQNPLIEANLPANWASR